jgi:pimeloyl-ACP methyl ester carboxylesterase
MDTSTFTRDGRTIELHTTGPRDAAHCVLLLHAAPGSGLHDPDPRLTREHDVFLVGVDRPGYGGSDRFTPGTWPTVATAADDAAAALDHLGRDQAGAVGWSAGGRVALGLAARHPDRVRRVAVLGTPAPQSDVPWVPDEQQQLVDDLARLPADEARRGLLEAMGAVFGGSHEDTWWLSQVGTDAADGDVLRDPRHRAGLARMLGHGMAGGIAGMTDDVLAYTTQPWGFDPAEVDQDTLLLYGADDALVPEPHGRWWHERVPRSRLRVLEGCGHVLVVPAWDEVLTHLTAP